mmetsp:Transcript_16545/g.30499  ORF Transcript_16545/g.30499 Transcript_16545/m.30499 type:complete len:711 (-) Transcript_16545:94-2226(-)
MSWRENVECWGLESMPVNASQNPESEYMLCAKQSGGDDEGPPGDDMGPPSRRLIAPAPRAPDPRGQNHRRLTGFVLTTQMYDFLDNAKVLAEYEHSFYYASCFIAALAVFWVAYRCLARKIQCIAASQELRRTVLVILMFNVGMIFYAWMSTVKAKEKAEERMDQCFGDNGEEESLDSSSDPDWKRWSEMGESIQEYSEYNVLDVVVSCATIGPVYQIEVASYWVFCVGVAFFLSAWLLARRVRQFQSREQKIVSNGQHVHCMPMDAVMRRSSIFSHVVYRGEEFEELPTLHMKLLTANDMLTSFSFDLVSFLFLQKFGYPSEMASWHPWKLLYELVFTAILKGIFAKSFALAVARGKRCGFIILVTSICLQICVIGFCFTAMVVLLWTFWDDDFGPRLLHVLDIGAGVGLVGCFLTPLSIELFFAITSTFWWEPKIRHHYKRVLVLRDVMDVARFCELLRDPERKDVQWFADEYVSSAWHITSIVNADGNELEAEPKKDKLADGKELDGDLETGDQVANGEVLEGGAAKDDKLRCLEDLEEAAFPLTVHVMNSKSGTISRFIVGQGDAFFGVDETMPVKPLKHNLGCCWFCFRSIADAIESLNEEDPIQDGEDINDSIEDGSATPPSRESKLLTRIDEVLGGLHAAQEAVQKKLEEISPKRSNPTLLGQLGAESRLSKSKHSAEEELSDCHKDQAECSTVWNMLTEGSI